MTCKLSWGQTDEPVVLGLASTHTTLRGTQERPMFTTPRGTSGPTTTGNWDSRSEVRLLISAQLRTDYRPRRSRRGAVESPSLSPSLRLSLRGKLSVWGNKSGDLNNNNSNNHNHNNQDSRTSRLEQQCQLLLLLQRDNRRCSRQQWDNNGLLRDSLNSQQHLLWVRTRGFLVRSEPKMSH